MIGAYTSRSPDLRVRKGSLTLFGLPTLRVNILATAARSYVANGRMSLKSSVQRERRVSASP